VLMQRDCNNCLLLSDKKPQRELKYKETRRQRLKLHFSASFDRKTIWTMTSAVNVRSQLIGGILIFISVIIQCDASNNCGSGKVLDDEDLHSN